MHDTKKKKKTFSSLWTFCFSSTVRLLKPGQCFLEKLGGKQTTLLALLPMLQDVCMIHRPFG